MRDKTIISTVGIVVATMLLFSLFSPLSVSTTGIRDDDSRDVVVQLLENTDDLIKIRFQVNNFEKQDVEINGEKWCSIHVKDEPSTLEKGFPSLPKICRSIIIPDDKKIGIKVDSCSYVDYENLMVTPSKGLIFRDVNPDDVPYEFGEIYQKDEWYPSNVVDLGEPYILRDFRGIVVEVHPFQYNPAQKKLRMYDEVVVDVYPAGDGEINVYNRVKGFERIDSEFKQVYKRHFINFDETMDRYNPVDEVGNMLVICYDGFYSTMKPFVTWKNMKGIPTEIVNLSEIGSSANDIKNYIINYYNTNGLTFVLLVGDIQQIPTLYYSGYAASDPSYTYVVGNDHYPDLFIGRFSAQNTDQLETQVERSIKYEKNPSVDGEWYHKGVGVASNQGPGDDGEYDYQHVRNIRAKLLGYTYTFVDEFYDGSQGGDDAPGNPTASMVANAVDDGRSILNYCGHGSATSWGTSGFSNYDINNLVNDNMLPYVICVACNNGQFDDYDECFCEAWLRATDDNNGEPAGAIVATGSSKSMSWSPPMDAQDEMNDILVESYVDNIKHSIGGIHFNGCMHMNDNYGSSGYSETDTWHLFGDPSLVIRTDTPVFMNVTHDSLLPPDNPFLNVIVDGVESALCALSRNGTLLAWNYTNKNGETTLYVSQPLIEGEELDLVVTGYNRIPYNATVEVGFLEVTFSRVLYWGWNLITIPVENNYTASTLYGDIPDCNIILGWNASLQDFDIYVPGSPYDFPIENGKGYFIGIAENVTTNNVTFNVTGLPIENVSIPLVTGWNMLGWYHEQPTTGRSIYENITGCTTVLTWNTSMYPPSFDLYAPGVPYNPSINQGDGFLVAVTQPSIWHGEG